MKINIQIREGSVEEVVQLSRSLPEFLNPHAEDVYDERLKGKLHLIAVAEVDQQLAGFKVGYDKFGDSSFYTWMGGVLPEYRKMGVARSLANFQESFVRKNGFDSIILKTRNRHKNMLLFALSSGFQIIGFEPERVNRESRILLKRDLF